MGHVSRHLVDPEELATMPAASIAGTAAQVLARAERLARDNDTERAGQLHSRAQALYAAATYRLLAEFAADDMSGKGGMS